jgi:hypothetical protein
MDIVTGIILLVASVVISAALMPKVQPPKPAAFDEFDFPQADEGTPQAVTFGDCWSEDWMVLGIGNYRTTSIEGDGGKK